MNSIKPYLGRIICMVIGAVSAVLLLTLGAVKTAIVLLCCGVGYTVGMLMDKRISLPKIRLDVLKPYLRTIICMTLGIITAVLFLTLGVAKTALILLCCGISYAIGIFHDKKLHLPDQLFFWRNRF